MHLTGWYFPPFLERCKIAEKALVLCQPCSDVLGPIFCGMAGGGGGEAISGDVDGGGA